MNHGRRATVLLVTFERLELTTRCIDAVLANTRCPVELCIIDNKSRPEVRNRLMQYPGTKVFLDLNIGFYRALNIGMSLINSDLVAILDCDIVVPVDWWEALSAEVATASDVGLAGSRYVNLDGSLQEGYPRLRPDGWYGSNSEDLSIAADCQYIAIGCSVVRRSAWQAVGGFDESYFISHGDIDFCYKLRYEGKYRIRYCPACSAIHDREQAKESAYEAVRFDSAVCAGDFERFKSKWQSRYATEVQFQWHPLSG